MITGFLATTSGEVKYRGASLKGLQSHEVANLGLIRTFQKTSVFAANSVFENVLIGLHRHGRSSVWQTLLSTRRVREEEARLRADASDIQTSGFSSSYSRVSGGSYMIPETLQVIEHKHLKLGPIGSAVAAVAESSRRYDN